MRETIFYLNNPNNLRRLHYGKDAHYINNPQSYHIYKVLVNDQSKLAQQLAASGGVAISLKKAGADDLKTLKRLE